MASGAVFLVDGLEPDRVLDDLVGQAQQAADDVVDRPVYTRHLADEVRHAVEALVEPVHGFAEPAHLRILPLMDLTQGLPLVLRRRPGNGYRECFHIGKEEFSLKKLAFIRSKGGLFYP